MKAKYLLAVAASAVLLTACGKQSTDTAQANQAPAAEQGAEEKVLNFYNWADYIPENMIADFEKETGIKVNYQTFESNEMLNAKLVAGNSGYDLVVPGSVFAKAQIEAGLLRKLDKEQIANYKNLDPAIMAKLGKVDPNNEYLVPWGWSYVTVAINKDAVEKALAGTAMPDNAWDLVFNPSYTSKLKSCGIAYLDTPSEILPSAMRYIGKPPYSTDVADYKAAGEMLAKVRSDVRIFSSTMIDDLSSGRACAAIGWAGDINIARTRAVENNSGIKIEALVPSTGAILFFDNLAIPKDAKHPGNAQKFIDYFLQPKVSASLTNALTYPVANMHAKEHVTPELANDKSTFLDADSMAKMVEPEGFSKEAREAMNNVFTEFKKGR